MDYDPSAMFSGYHTFTWMPRQHHALRNESVAVQTQAAIEAELVRKGFSSVADPANADFVVDFTIGPQDRIDVDTYPIPIPGSAADSRGSARHCWRDALQRRADTSGTAGLVQSRRLAAGHGMGSRELRRA